MPSDTPSMRIGPDEHDHVAVEGHEVADRDRPVDGLAPAHEQDRRQPELGQEAQERVVEGAQPGGHHRLVEHARYRAVEPLDLAPLLREGLDHAHAAHVLLGLGGQLRDPLLHLLRGGAVQPPVAGGDPDHQRHRCQCHRGQQRVHGDHHDRRDHDRQERLHHEDQPVAQEEAHRLEVHGRARHQLAGLLAVEEAQLQRLEVAVHQVAQVELHAKRHAAGHQPPDHAEGQPQQPGGHEHAASGHRLSPPSQMSSIVRPTRNGISTPGAHRRGGQQQRADHSARDRDAETPAVAGRPSRRHFTF